MAERRMFAKSIVLSDSFLDMPMSARCLYFTLGMLADDDGFINAPKGIMRQAGCSEDDMKLLIAKSYVIPFESGVVVIRHWRLNNYLQKDRINPTKCVDERETLEIDKTGAYQKVDTPTVYTQYMDTQIRLGKDSIEKDNSIRTFRPPTLDEVKEYCQSRNNGVNAERWYAHYEAVGWKVGRNKMKDWKAAVRTWEEDKPKKQEYGEFYE